ncbi:uncharacterized protein LOC8065328 [Sorghum bicolor]|uniref:uncharacterized protein LOC8065328 n=1 Tax=Sorghum bicolor TaxID=4558 RepID=UPI000B4251F2|nr:uncharacterized protein LOC8065328 [Sorghum bicolor]|eukprot:XP_002441631.2 uncharacterized protein LOC8065328 [Sorghum bicolor]
MAKGPISDESTQREVTWSFKVDRLEEQVDIFGDNEHMSTGYSMEIPPGYKTQVEASPSPTPSCPRRHARQSTASALACRNQPHRARHRRALVLVNVRVVKPHRSSPRRGAVLVAAPTPCPGATRRSRYLGREPSADASATYGSTSPRRYPPAPNRAAAAESAGARRRPFEPHDPAFLAPTPHASSLHPRDHRAELPRCCDCDHPSVTTVFIAFIPKPSGSHVPTTSPASRCALVAKPRRSGTRPHLSRSHASNSHQLRRSRDAVTTTPACAFCLHRANSRRRALWEGP